ncbi:MAG: EpsG family protein [Ruminococcaceae bacterium]|nr:EpsG family protein [Oscillospiraceae bacterium]
MSIYWGIVAAAIICGMMMPQEGRERKYYVILITFIHWFVCAFRYQFLTGDLIKYNTEFRHLRNVSYLSEQAIHDWKNTLFYWLMKFVGDTTDGNYQAFLIILATICCLIAGIFIYRYSPRPWFSFVVWNCLGFYVTYDYLAVKQGLAMAILMISMMCILERKPCWFLFWTLVAGFIHMPALCFLPAYFLANWKLDKYMVALYIAAAVIIFFSRNQIVQIVGEAYYEDISFTLTKETLGGRTIVIILMLVAGILLRGFRERQFNQLFHIIVVAAILQMFSGFDNVFTRLADYYLQFTVLYIPMIFYDVRRPQVNRLAAPPIFPFNFRSRKILAACIVLILIWWYDTTMLGHTISYETDNFLNYRFMWDVG